MGMTDPIADMLTRMRNAIMAEHEVVEMPTSTTKEAVANVMKGEGYITDFSVIDTKPQGTLRVELRYFEERKSAVIGLKRVSRPGRRAYYGAQDIPKVRNGLGVGIVSTNKGVITDREARRQKVGGEMMIAIW